MSLSQDMRPEERLLRLWQQGLQPDLDQFVANSGVTDAEGLVAILRVDQTGRWQLGSPIRVEEYLQHYPLVATDAEAAVELILSDFMLAESRGVAPDPAEFVQRFPAYSTTLRNEIDWYRVVARRATAETISPLHNTAKLGTSAAPHLNPSPTASDGGQATPTNRELPNPFGRYQILELLGRGGMGAVYAAYDPQLDRRVALKVPDFVAGDEEGIQHFIREARIAAHFNDPHLCPVYEVGEIGGIHYLTMPVIDGQTLGSRLRATGPFPPREAVRVAKTLASAMAVAHADGIIHRDLTPANIFLNHRGEPVITDFGLARQTTCSESDSPVDRRIAGTPAYMAPEQVVADTAAIGPATDVYAIGVMLYEMLTGTRPFEGPLGTVLAHIVAAEPESPSRRRPGINRQLAAICCKALAKSPVDRYSTMAELVDALDSWSQEAERAESRRAGRARQAARTLVAIVPIIGAGIFIWHPWRSALKHDERSPAVAVRDSEAAVARAELAWRLNNDGDLERAVEESTGALRLDDQCASALHCRGHAWIKRKEPQRAVDDLRRAVSVDPHRHEAIVDLAWVLNELGAYEEALKFALQAIAIKPDSSEAHNQAGWSRFKQGMHQAAIADFAAAIQHNPHFAWAYRNLALTYKAVGENELATMNEAKADELDAAADKKK